MFPIVQNCTHQFAMDLNCTQQNNSSDKILPSTLHRIRSWVFNRFDRFLRDVWCRSFKSSNVINYFLKSNSPRLKVFFSEKRRFPAPISVNARLYRELELILLSRVFRRRKNRNVLLKLKKKMYGSKISVMTEYM